jgi:hypothetical protein
MKALVQKRELATKLRKNGLSYNEIIKEVKVAKSTLSLWLKDTPLTNTEKAALKNRLNGNISRGRIKASAANRERRLVREKTTVSIARKEFSTFAPDPLFHFGVALYWAEGAKNSGTVMFINSDIEMVRVMLTWIEKYTEYRRSELRYRLYVHKAYEHENCEDKWAEALGVLINNFTKTSYKPSNKGVKQKLNYQGCMRVEIPKSINLLLKIKVWTNLMVEYHVKQ